MLLHGTGATRMSPEDFSHSMSLVFELFHNLCMISVNLQLYSLYILYVTRIFNFKSICSMRSPFHISTHKQTKIIIKPRKFLYPGSLYTCQAKKIEGNEFLMGHGINTIDISIIIFKIICTVSSCTTSRIRISNIMCRSYFFW